MNYNCYISLALFRHLRQIVRNKFDEVGWELPVIAVNIRSVEPLGIDFIHHIDGLVFLKKRNK